MHRRRCWAEVDLDALRGNLAWLRHRVGAGVKIVTVVKADAYGHGLKPIAGLLMQAGTDVFGVANLAEAMAIRSVGRGWPILMLGAALPDEVETVVREGVMPTISSWTEAERFQDAAQKLGAKVSAHVKVDTGMGRLGVAVDEAFELIEQMRGLDRIQLAGLFTHYASAEDDAEFSSLQQERFLSLVRRLESAKIFIPLIHVNGSAAILNQPATTFNGVRPGLLVYGIVPPGRRMAPGMDGVRPALSFFSRVAFVKDVPANTPLSYGGTYITPRSMRIATIAAGYGDGYPRAASNRGEVLIRGARCRIVGRITMDQMLADVSGVSGVEPGDEVVLIGSQGNEMITVLDVAGWSGGIPWEVLTGITSRVPRFYRGAQAA